MGFLNRIASRYFSLLLLLSCGLAFFIPPPGPSSSHWIMLALFAIIFASFFRFDLTPSLLMPLAKQAGIYVFARYLFFPLIVFFLLDWFSPFYAFVCFFLLLMPAAVSSPAFTSLFGAGINLSMLVLLGSSFFSIASISILTPLLAFGAVEIGMGRFLLTLLVCILLPFLMHLPLRRSKRFASAMASNIPLITILALAAIFLLAIAGNKEAILANPKRLIEYLLVSLVFYAILYAAGWLAGYRSSLEDKMTFSVSSGMNNIGLAVSLALLYLPSEVCVFLITAEFAWVGILLPLRLLFHRFVKASTGKF